MSVLEELSAAVTTVADRVSPAIVSIGGGWRGGSGVVIGDGLVLTNAHNVRHDEVPVAFVDGRTAQASVAGVDLDGDLAVIRVDTSGVAPLEWGTSAATLGTPVFAVAASSHGARVTFGLVSSIARSFRGPRGRRISGSIEHSAPMPRGSSGSALVDGDGRLIGINTNRVGDGFYLAIPTDEALRGRIDALARGESGERPQLGIAVAPAHVARRLRRAVGLPDRDGILIREVGDGTPAERAGIESGDLLVAAGGRPVASVDDLFDALGAVGAGGSLDVTLVRGTEERTASVSFTPSSGERSDASGGAGATAAGTDPGSPVH